MTKLLEQAMARVRDLPVEEQDAIAQLVLTEIESEQLWERLFSKAPEKLRQLADEAWAEHEAGQTEPLDPETL